MVGSKTSMPAVLHCGHQRAHEHHILCLLTFLTTSPQYLLASLGDLQTSKEAKQLRLGQSSCPKGWYVPNDPSLRWANGGLDWFRGC